MATETLVVQQDGTPLDLLLYRKYGREIPGFVEQTLAANPNLFEQGPILPVGTQVVVTIPAPTARRTKRVVRLWGGG